MHRSTVEVIAGYKSSGEPVLEEVLVDDMGGGQFHVVASPTVAVGFAADDVITVGSGSLAQVVRRGTNVVVQLYGPPDAADAALTGVEAAGGRIDGRAKDLSTFTIPVAFGFSAIQRVFNGTVDRHENAEWFYGTVYDPDDGVTPLNWWRPE